jgi:hypothetical protein
MNKKLGLFFFLKNSKINANGLLPVYLRITIAGLRTDISSNRFIDPAKWNNLSQKVTGTSEEVRSINSSLKALEIKTYRAFGEMTDKKLSITSSSIKSFMLNEGVQPIFVPEKMILGFLKPTIQK